MSLPDLTVDGICSLYQRRIPLHTITTLLGVPTNDIYSALRLRGLKPNRCRRPDSVPVPTPTPSPTPASASRPERRPHRPHPPSAAPDPIPAPEPPSFDPIGLKLLRVNVVTLAGLLLERNWTTTQLESVGMDAGLAKQIERTLIGLQLLKSK